MAGRLRAYSENDRSGPLTDSLHCLFRKFSMQPFSVSLQLYNNLTIKAKHGTMGLILLKEQQGECILPIWVGVPEGNALVQHLNEIATPRPRTSRWNGGLSAVFPRESSAIEGRPIRAVPAAYTRPACWRI